MKQVIRSDKAPHAVGIYSQAIKAGNTVYLSGQIPVDPNTMKIVEGSFIMQTRQVFENLKAVAEAAGGDLSHIVKMTIYLVDMENFPDVNEVMQAYCKPPYPARACVAVKALPLSAQIEIDAVIMLGE